MDNQIIEVLIMGLFSVIAWLGKQKINSMEERIKSLEDEDMYIKDVYFKKEDFKEFKAELWDKLDRMERTMESKLDHTIKAFRLTDFPPRM